MSGPRRDSRARRPPRHSPLGRRNSRLRRSRVSPPAAALMGIDQPKVSALLNGRLANFSSDRLMRLLTTLGQDVEIRIKATSRGRAHGQIRVTGEMLG